MSFFGRTERIDCLVVNFEGGSITGMTEALRDAADDHITYRKEEGHNLFNHPIDI